VANLISAQAAVQKLRALREQFLATLKPPRGGSRTRPVCVRASEMRDETPYEDERGLLSFDSPHH